VIFGGFSSQAIADRVEDAKSDIIITPTAAGGAAAPVLLKQNVDEALMKTDRVKTVVVFERTGSPVKMIAGRDVALERRLRGSTTDCPCEENGQRRSVVRALHVGIDGKPKGIVHTTGGYMVGTYVTSKYVFDLREDDVYWCTADVGWVTATATSSTVR